MSTTNELYTYNAFSLHKYQFWISDNVEELHHTGYLLVLAGKCAWKISRLLVLNIIGFIKQEPDSHIKVSLAFARLLLALQQANLWQIDNMCI